MEAGNWVLRIVGHAFKENLCYCGICPWTLLARVTSKSITTERSTQKPNAHWLYIIEILVKFGFCEKREDVNPSLMSICYLKYILARHTHTKVLPLKILWRLGSIWYENWRMNRMYSTRASIIHVMTETSGGGPVDAIYRPVYQYYTQWRHFRYCLGGATAVTLFHAKSVTVWLNFSVLFSL